MRRRLPIIMPPGRMFGVLAVPLLLFLIVAAISDLSVWRILGEFPKNGMLMQLLLDQERRAPWCIMFALLYGGFRGTAFHPAFRPGYREWLSDTPWTSRLPLPLGPIHLVWQDLCFIVPPMVIAWGADLGFVVAVPIVFLSAYSVCIMLSLFVTQQRGIAFLSSFVAGLAVYLGAEAILHRISLWPTLGVVVVLYALLAWGLRRSLARIERWDGIWLTALDVFGASIRAAYGLTAPAQAATQLGWPFDGLPLRRRFRYLAVQEEIVVALLAGWWLYAAHVDDMFLPLLIRLLLAVPLVIAVAIWFVCRPPISFLGRLRTGRLIIPGYDRGFFWPAAMFVIQWGWLSLAADYGLPLLVTAAVQMALFVACVFRAWPAFERFQLTGTHRLATPFTFAMNKQMFTSA